MQQNGSLLVEVSVELYTPLLLQNTGEMVVWIEGDA
jgi:hypothetical protein